MSTNRDQKMLQFAEQLRESKHNVKKLVRGRARAYLVGLYGDEEYKFIDELMMEFDEIAYRSAT